MCLNGPAALVFLVSRNRWVPGCLLNSVLGAEAWQLWQCCNNYQPSLLSPPLIPVQRAAALVCVSLTHSKSLKNWEDWMAFQSTLYIFSRTYSRPGTQIIPLENIHNRTLSFIQNKALHLTHFAAFFAEWGNTSAASSAAKWAWENPHSSAHFTSFPLPSVLLCHHFLTVTFGAHLRRITCRA